MEDDFQVHELSRADPLDVLALEGESLVDSLKVVAHVFYALLNLVVLVGLFEEGKQCGRT